MPEIILTGDRAISLGLVAIVDDEDYEAANQWAWKTRINRGDVSQIYVCRWVGVGEEAPGRSISLHQFILPVPDGLTVDHRNGNGLDNRRENLRMATHSQNAANRQRLVAGASSAYKGVTWDRSRKAWMAQIGTRAGHRTLGRFASETEAAHAYDAAALAQWGEFAHTNFGEETAHA